MIDLKSDTLEKDRLHTDIFDTLDVGSVSTNDDEEEEEEKEDKEGEIDEEDAAVMRLDLPPGRREHQKRTYDLFG